MIKEDDQIAIMHEDYSESIFGWLPYLQIC